MAKAVQALQAKEVNRIILTRPPSRRANGSDSCRAPEREDRPLLRPLYDALHDMLDPETIPKLLTAGTIEVAPLAYMRGRTLNDAFIILDEAQNTSPEQMKMFLTRLDSAPRWWSPATHPGRPARRHPSGSECGARHPHRGADVHFSRLTSHDVVRHKLVGRIVAAYETYDAPRSAPGAGAAAVSVEVLNESGADLDVALRGARPLRARPDADAPAAEMCLRLSTRPPSRSSTSGGWTEGPTDVLAFPMDELTPGQSGRSPRRASR